MKWIKKPVDKELIKLLMRKFDCDALTASILARRNLVDGENALYSLETSSRYLNSPFLFNSMEDVVDRILNAKDEGEKVLVFGDRDVDGLTGTAILYEALMDLGLDVSWRIPTGDETYGLSYEVIEEFANNDGTLIITVDCGISDIEEIDFANSMHVDVIITDHHKPQEKIPNALAIINPQLENSGYPLKEISGCTVAWKLVLALRFATTEMYKCPICLLNVRPINDAYTVEVYKMLNLVVTENLIEHIQEGALSFNSTRLPNFLQGQQIFVWNKNQQTKMLERIFGSEVEFHLCDLQPMVAKKYPKLGNTSLLRLKDFSTIGKYIPKKNTEIDAFSNIFITFVQSKNRLFSAREMEEIQLVALSTIADMMSLKSENRMILKLGLKSMNKKLHRSLADILAKQEISGFQIGTHEIAWFISPVLNSAGRMGRAEVGAQLLIAKEPAKRNELVKQLFQMNNERKALGRECQNIILDDSYKSFDEHNQKLVVVFSDKINRGVSGILASWLVNVFNVPAVVICEIPDGTVTGSCRSVKGFHILDLLMTSKELFEDYGGHDYAAGFTLKKKNLPVLLQNFKQASSYIEFTDPSNLPIEIDAELPQNYLTADILKYVDKFEPFGEGFPELTFMTRNLQVEESCIMGRTERKHLKLTLQCNSTKWTAIFWGKGDLLEQVRANSKVDVVYNVNRNFFNGNVYPQMILLDMKPHN